MTPGDLRMAADTLAGEARGRLLERADVLEDLLARIPKTDPYEGQDLLESLAEFYTKALHVTPDPDRLTIPFADLLARAEKVLYRQFYSRGVDAAHVGARREPPSHFNPKQTTEWLRGFDDPS